MFVVAAGLSVSLADSWRHPIVPPVADVPVYTVISSVWFGLTCVGQKFISIPVGPSHSFGPASPSSPPPSSEVWAFTSVLLAYSLYYLFLDL